jgi:hypothetical protein
MRTLFACLTAGLVVWGTDAVASPPAAIREAEAINRRLGRGVNMGNMFESPEEGAWGNAWQSGDFRIIAGLGFRHVRLPVRWEGPARSLEEPPYTIRPEFLARIRAVVDEAQAEGLLVVLNMHHHERFLADPDGQRARFVSQWRQIAEAFQGVPDTLLFELLNEPNGALTPEKWNDCLASALSAVRESNPTRIVMIGPGEWNSLAALPRLRIPEDPRLILTVHYYHPFSFTHQGASWAGPHAQSWLGTRWRDSEWERDEVRSQFQPLLDLHRRTGIPVHVGEFGAYERADLPSRVRWTRFLARFFDEQRFSWAYWEFSAGFGIYDRPSKTPRRPLVNALLNEILPPPAKAQSRTVHSFDFEKNPEGWILQAHGDARAEASVSDGQTLLAIRQAGARAWEAQWIRGGLALEKGTAYRVLLRASSSVPVAVGVYLGPNRPPWGSYSGWNTVTFGPEPSEQSFLFTMKEASDPEARMIWDVGAVAADLRIESVRIEAIDWGEDG